MAEPVPVLPKLKAFGEKNAGKWLALEAYNARLGKLGGARRLGREEVMEAARLQRLASYHLAYARTHFPGSEAETYLNNLVAASQCVFYVRRGSGSAFARYFSESFPCAVRGARAYWGLAAALFALAAMFSALYVSADLGRLAQVMPEGMAERFSPYEAPDFGGGGIDGGFSLFAAQILGNNIAVAINAFASGIFLGIGTAYIMLVNGLALGGLFGYLHTVGADMPVAYALVLPHGVLELFAIFICGGCGLMLGRGLLVPGELSRKDSLIFHARKAAVLMPGVALMLALAALVEGFFTPLAVQAEFKLFFAALTGIAFIAYCALVGDGLPAGGHDD